MTTNATHILYASTTTPMGMSSEKTFAEVLKTAPALRPVRNGLRRMEKAVKTQFNRLLDRCGHSDRGRLLLGWLDEVKFLVTLHTLPALWAVETFVARNQEEKLLWLHYQGTGAMNLDALARNREISKGRVREALRETYYKAWRYETLGQATKGLHYFSGHKVRMCAVGALAFLLSSPMLLLSLPVLVGHKSLTTVWAAWRRRRSYADYRRNRTYLI